jgi:hypothetical protein
MKKHYIEKLQTGEFICKKEGPQEISRYHKTELEKCENPDEYKRKFGLDQNVLQMNTDGENNKIADEMWSVIDKRAEDKRNEKAGKTKYDKLSKFIHLYNLPALMFNLDSMNRDYCISYFTMMDRSGDSIKHENVTILKEAPKRIELGS